MVDQVLDKKEDRTLPTHTDPIELANEFNQYYIEKIDKLRASIQPVVDTEILKTNFEGVKLDTFAPSSSPTFFTFFSKGIT